MKLVKLFSVLAALAGVGVLALGLALVLAPAVYSQRDDRPDRRARELAILAGRGAAIGVSVRDVVPAEAGGQTVPGGVLIDDVRPGTPADKAGLKRGDIVVQFDGETVRSARQFSRLVQETPPGRTVKASIVRDGRRSDMEITPDDRRGDVMISGDFGDYMRDLGGHLGRDLERLGDHLPPFNFNFDFDMPSVTGRRLGVAVDELTGQLAEYFGAKDGLLVTSVTEGSAASKAGLKAGDVITSANGDRVRSREDLLRALRDAREGDEVTIGIVRDKKESTVRAKVEPPRRTLRGRPA